MYVENPVCVRHWRGKDERGECKENNKGKHNIKVINRLLWKHRIRSNWSLLAGFIGQLLELETENCKSFLVEKEKGFRAT